MKLGVVALVLATAGLAGAVQAAPPTDADPAWSPWFQSLQRPDGGGSCCSASDCRPTEFRVMAGHFEAHYRDGWLVIPDSKVVARVDNPTGRAVLCADGDGTAIMIYCFVPGAES